MKVDEFLWKRSKSVELYGKLCTPTDASMNVLVVVVHGLSEHTDCYDDLAEKFTAQSVGVFTFDLRGHGLSSGRRGHTSIRNTTDDLQLVIENMHQRFPDVPIVLFGHSLGGHIVLHYAVNRNINVQGIIASSPWLKLANPPSPLIVGLAKWASYVIPWFTVRVGIKAEQLAIDGVGVRSAKTDPLLHQKISVKLFSDMWTNAKTMRCSRRRIEIPLLVMHGTADSLTSHLASKSFVQNAGENAVFKQWHDMYHDLLNDIRSEVVFRYMMKWLLKQIIDKENGTVQNRRKMYRIA